MGELHQIVNANKNIAFPRGRQDATNIRPPPFAYSKQSLQFQLICFRQRGGFCYEMWVLFKQIQPEMYNLQGPFARTNAQQF